MKYHVSQLIDLAELQALMEALHRATGINHALLDTEGKVLTAAGWQQCCTDFHRAHPDSCKRCQISDQYILKHLHDGPYVSYECLNGLFEYATPVLIGGAHVATIFTGQLLHQPPDIARFSSQAREFSFNEEAYIAAISRIKVVPREQMPDVMRFLVKLAESLSKSGLARMKQLEANAELETVVQSRTAELVNTIRMLESEIAARNVAEKALRESQSELRQLAANQDRVKEVERKRIAREIHDELGQTLLALRLDVSALLARAGEHRPRLRERCTATQQAIDSTIRTVKAIINDLRPPALDLGLAAAIEWLVREFRRRSGIAVTLTVDEGIPDLDDESTTAVFRIVQESLTNVQRHARASRVDVVLENRQTHLLVRVADNGIGIAQASGRKGNAFGLLGIHERARLMDGELTIDSGAGSGTTIQVSIPHRKPAAPQSPGATGLTAGYSSMSSAVPRNAGRASG